MLNRLRRAAGVIRRHVFRYRRLVADPETPWPARLLLGLAVGYLLLPFDLVPDWIPVLGLLDDLIVVPLLVWLATRLIPKRVLERHDVPRDP